MRHEVKVNTLQPGAPFRFTAGLGRWVYGHVVFANASRARVVLYDQRKTATRTVGAGKAKRTEEYRTTEDEETNVPNDMTVEPLDGQAGRPSMVVADDVKAAGLKAKYNYQQKQLALAQEAGQADKIEVAKSRIKQLEKEAKEGKVELPVYDEDRTTHQGPRQPETKPDPEVENDPAVKKAREKAKAAKEKGLTKEEKKAKVPVIDRSKKKLATHNCICGCERETGSLYAPGHDARIKGILLKVERGELEKSTIPKQVVPFVKWSGKWGTDTCRLTAAPVKIPGRPEVENTTLAALEALDV